MSKNSKLTNILLVFPKGIRLKMLYMKLGQFSKSSWDTVSGEMISLSSAELKSNYK